MLIINNINLIISNNHNISTTYIKVLIFLQKQLSYGSGCFAIELYS